VGIRLDRLGRGAATGGHPTPEALCRIHQAGARIYTTLNMGDVSVETDGANVTVTPAVAEPAPC
jgi:beta-lactamase superfamily II metal-dependent hydrolase